MQIKVKPVKTRQGFITYRPVCENAKMIIELTWRKNITQNMVDILRSHGVEVIEEKK